MLTEVTISNPSDPLSFYAFGANSDVLLFDSRGTPLWLDSGNTYLLSGGTVEVSHGGQTAQLSVSPIAGAHSMNRIMCAPSRLSRSSGFSYLEVMIATVLVALTLVPALEALQSGIAVAKGQQDYAASHYRIQGLFEEVLSQPFDELEAEAKAVGNPATATSYSDSSGDDQRLVYLANYDGDNADADDDGFTGTDDDLLWVKIEVANVAFTLETLIAR